MTLESSHQNGYVPGSFRASVLNLGQCAHSHPCQVLGGRRLLRATALSVIFLVRVQKSADELNQSD